MKKRRAFTVAEAAKHLRISRQAVNNAVQSGRLKSEIGEITFVQKVRLIPASALKDYRVSLSHKQRGKKTDLA